MPMRSADVGIADAMPTLLCPPLGEEGKTVLVFMFMYFVCLLSHETSIMELPSRSGEKNADPTALLAHVAHVAHVSCLVLQY